MKTVNKLTLDNGFLEIAVSDRYPGTNLSLGITGGLPEEPEDNNKPLLFGHPSPYTSYTTLWIDGDKIKYGAMEGNLIEDPYVTSDDKGIERCWQYKNIEIKQKISFAISEWSETKYEDTALIQYIIKSIDFKILFSN